MARSFNDIRETYLGEIEKKITEIGSGLCADMTAYHFETGGKRLRALIPLCIYDAFGKDPKSAVALGAAVEMIHNATLVHDDLQDGDEVRRGRPTVWKKYSPAQSINCGDAMFQFATRLLVQLDTASEKLVRLIDRAALSTLNVIEGQAQEFVMKDEQNPGVSRYLSVIRGKTSGLFALPVVGAMEALGLDAKHCQAAERASMDLGMLFQIQDDLLDVYGQKGRDRVATDIAEGKISILVAHVNEVGSAADKSLMQTVLRKPREQTTNADIDQVMSIFARYDAKGMALGHIRKIQNSVASNPELKACPEVHRVLLELGELFLEPVNGIF